MKVIKQADLSLQKDAHAVVSLLNEYAAHEMGGSKGLSVYAKTNLVNELRKRENSAVFIAYIDDVPAGLVICFEMFSTFQCRPILNIHDVVVSADFRGQKLSKELFFVVEKYAVERGCCKITLEVLEGNVIAKRAYESLGYSGYELDPKVGKALFYEKLLDLDLS